MSIRWLVRGVACVAVLAASATSSRTPGAEPEPRYFCTQVGDAWEAPIHRIVPGPDGSVYAAGVAYHATLVGEFAVGSDDRRHEVYVARMAPGGAVERVSRAETRGRADGRWDDVIVRCIAVATDGSVWIVGLGGMAPVGPPDLFGSVDQKWTDAWVAKFAPDGTLSFAMNLGGADYEQVNGLALTPGGDAVLVGTTQSPDFPTLGAFQPTYGGGCDDGFVALVRGDGSGLAWSSFLGGPQDDDANAVAITADGDILVASRSRDTQYSGCWQSVLESDDMRTLFSTTLTRLSSDGAVLSSTPLPFVGRGGVFALAVEPDGRILAGGATGSATAWHEVIARLTRLSPDGASVEGEWSEEGSVVRAIARAPDGRIFVGTGFVGTGSHEFQHGGRLVAPGLDGAAPPIDVRKFGGNSGYVYQFAMAPDGALCAFATGFGLPFGDGRLSSAEYPMFVSRIPLDGADPPSRLVVVANGRRRAEVAWTRDGDAFAAYQIEASTGPDLLSPTYAPAAVLPGDARSVRLSDLRPGQYQFVRVIAVLPSGVRVLVPEAATFRTEPDGVTSVHVHQWLYGVAVAIRSRNGVGTTYEVERCSGFGPWVRLRPVQGDASHVHHAWDGERLRSGEIRRYRVRAAVGGRRTPWNMSYVLLGT